MNSAYRFAIPIGLGLLAAGTNYYLINQATMTVEVVVVTKDLAQGERLAPDCLAKLNVRADQELFNAVVQGRDMATLYKQSIARPVKKGGLVFRADVIDADSLMNGMELKAGEAPRQVIVPYATLVPGLRIKDTMLLTFRTDGGRKANAPELASGQLKARFLGAVTYVPKGGRASEPQWQVVFAAPANDPAVNSFFDAYPNASEHVISISKYVQSDEKKVASLGADSLAK